MNWIIRVVLAFVAIPVIAVKEVIFRVKTYRKHKKELAEALAEAEWLNSPVSKMHDVVLSLKDYKTYSVNYCSRNIINPDGSKGSEHWEERSEI